MGANSGCATNYGNGNSLFFPFHPIAWLSIIRKMGSNLEKISRIYFLSNKQRVRLEENEKGNLSTI